MKTKKLPEILEFRGKYEFLSNFYPSLVYLYSTDPTLPTRAYPTVEHAFQAAKSLSDADRVRIQRAKTPGIAKRIGRLVALRPVWDSIKLECMVGLLRQKFETGVLRAALLETGDATLEEGNTWGDVFWGVIKGTRLGSNHLGRLLMKIRDELKAEVR